MTKENNPVLILLHYVMNNLVILISIIYYIFIETKKVFYFYKLDICVNWNSRKPCLASIVSCSYPIWQVYRRFPNWEKLIVRGQFCITSAEFKPLTIWEYFMFRVTYCFSSSLTYISYYYWNVVFWLQKQELTSIFLTSFIFMSLYRRLMWTDLSF